MPDEIFYAHSFLNNLRTAHLAIFIQQFIEAGMFLFSGQGEPGGFELAWPGVDERGQRVASGVYFCRLQTSWGYTETRKLVLVQ